jgi:hypothetical protein
MYDCIVNIVSLDGGGHLSRDLQIFYLENKLLHTKHLNMHRHPSLSHNINVPDPKSLRSMTKNTVRIRNFYLKVHKNENFFGFNFEFSTISVLVMHK